MANLTRPGSTAGAVPASAMAVPQPPRFILVEPSHPGNVGAAARALKVMGFADLVLVGPRLAGVREHADALAMASGATDVLAAARVVPDLAAALRDIDYACATAMTPRDFGPPTAAPRALFESLVSALPRLAVVFGAERHGLTNDAVYRCNVCLSIPTAPGYGSLNLAQAVQLVAYELRLALGGFAVQPRTPPLRHADLPAVQGLIDHWHGALVRLGFLDPAVPKKLMPRLRRLVFRARPTEEEVHILRGIARAIEARTVAPRE